MENLHKFNMKFIERVLSLAKMSINLFGTKFLMYVKIGIYDMTSFFGIAF